MAEEERELVKLTGLYDKQGGKKFILILIPKYIIGGIA